MSRTAASARSPRQVWMRAGLVCAVAAIGIVVATTQAARGADGDSVSVPVTFVSVAVLIGGLSWATGWWWMLLAAAIPAVLVAAAGPLGASDDGEGALGFGVMGLIGLAGLVGCVWYAIRTGGRLAATAETPFQPPQWRPGEGPGPGPSQAFGGPTGWQPKAGPSGGQYYPERSDRQPSLAPGRGSVIDGGHRAAGPSSIHPPPRPSRYPPAGSIG